MANKTEYSRLRLKRSGQTGVEPTIPTGTTIDNTWLPTDLLIGEGFLNTVDDRLWYRTNNGVVEVPLSGFSSSNYYTDSAFLSGNTIFFNRTDLPLAYSVDLSSIVSGSTNTNFANTDLTFTSNRNHDTDGNSLEITTDGGTYGEGWMYIDTAESYIGHNDAYIQAAGGQVIFFADNTPIARVTNDRTFYSENGRRKSLDNISAGTTLDTSSNVINCTANTFTLDLPSATLIAGQEYIIKNSGTGVITIQPDGTETIDGLATLTLNQNDVVTIMSDGTNWIKSTSFSVDANTFTTGATLNGSVIEFDRNDLTNAYNVDIQPVLDNYLPLEITGNTLVTVDNSVLNFSGNSTSEIQSYVTHDIDNVTGLFIDEDAAQLVNVDFSDSRFYLVQASKLTGVRLASTFGLSTRAQIQITDSEIDVAGDSSFSGITYNGDYSLNFVNRSLVDKEYVDLAISGFSNTDNYTTGATLSNGVISFDRTDLTNAYSVDINPALQDYLPLNITGTTIVTVDGQTLSFTGNAGTAIYNYVGHDTDRITGNFVGPGGSYLLSIDDGTNDGFFVEASYNDGANMRYGDGFGPINEFKVTKNGIVASSTLTGFTGIEYQSDYSTNYTNRSLVDKEYVDNVVSSSTFTGNTSASCITDLYVSNLYGCSPITINDDIDLVGKIFANTGNSELDLTFMGDDNVIFLGTTGSTDIVEGLLIDPDKQRDRLSIFSEDTINSQRSELNVSSTNTTLSTYGGTVDEYDSNIGTVYNSITNTISTINSTLSVLGTASAQIRTIVDLTADESLITLTADEIVVNGNTNITGSLSATTLYGDGSNLTGVNTEDNFVTGGTFSTGTLTLDRQNGSVTITGFTSGPMVTSLTTGFGLSANTTTGDITILNTEPDQIVTLSASTGISTSGTYPNFTITNTEPDQIVTLSGGTDISVVGTYPNFTIDYTGAGGSSGIMSDSFIFKSDSGIVADWSEPKIITDDTNWSGVTQIGITDEGWLYENIPSSSPFIDISNWSNSLLTNNIQITERNGSGFGYYEVTGITYDSVKEAYFIDVVYINGNDSFSTASKYYSLSKVLKGAGQDNYTTGATLNGTTLEFDRTDLANAYSVDLSSLATDYYVTGGTYSNGTLTLNRNGLSDVTVTGFTTGGTGTIYQDIIIAVSDEITSIASGTSKVTYYVPSGMYLTNVKASLTQSGSTNTVVDINQNGSSVLSTVITIEANEFKSVDATTQPVISTNTLSEDSRITIDIDQGGTGAKGLKVYLIGYRL